MEWPGLNKEGAQTPVDAPIVQLVGEALADSIGQAATITAFPAGCDLPYLRNDGGMPSVIFGPGDPAIAQTSGEHAVLDEVVAAARTLALTLLRWQ